MVVRPHIGDHIAGTYCGVTIHFNRRVPEEDLWVLADRLEKFAEGLSLRRNYVSDSDQKHQQELPF